MEQVSITTLQVVILVFMSKLSAYDEAERIKELFWEGPAQNELAQYYPGVGTRRGERTPNPYSPWVLQVDLERPIPEDLKQKYSYFKGIPVEFDVTGPACAYSGKG